MNEDFLKQKLQQRVDSESFRQLHLEMGEIDFCSNDYLGIVKKKRISFDADDLEKEHGSTGSRLISGNYALIAETEKMIAAFHHAESGLLFNSGYDANIGLLSCVVQRDDTIIYDQLSHASIRDGDRQSNAKSFAFIMVQTTWKKTENGRKKICGNQICLLDGWPPGAYGK